MTDFLKPLFLDQVDPSLKCFVDKLENNTRALFKNKLGLSYGSGYASLSLPDWKRALASINVENSPVELCTKNAVLECCIRAENSAALGGLIAAAAFVQHQKSKHPSEIDLSFLKRSIRLRKKECMSLIQSTIGDEYASSIIMDAVELAGFSGQIFVNDSSNKSTSLELRSGFNFPISCIPEFFDIMKLKDWTAENAAVIIIDGIVESVGEIHTILDYCCSNNQPAIIFARGYSEEVVATIITNNMRGTLKLAPLRVPLDLSGLNMLKDLAVVCRSDVVSSLKGELISAIDPGSLPIIDLITIAERSTTVTNHGIEQSVSCHIKELIKKRAEQPSPDVERLIDDRLQCLSSNNVIINLGPELMTRRGSTADKIATGLQLLKDVSNFGVINTHAMATSANPIIQGLGDLLIQFGYRYFSSRSLHAGAIMGIRTSELISSAPVFLVQ